MNRMEWYSKVNKQTDDVEFKEKKEGKINKRMFCAFLVQSLFLTLKTKKSKTTTISRYANRIGFGI